MKLLTFTAEFEAAQAEIKATGDYKAAFEGLEVNKELLGQTLRLCHFVACDADGEPMKRPKPSDTKGAGVQVYREAMQAYQTALDAVIFEGWEVESDYTNRFGVHIKNGDNYLSFWIKGKRKGWITLPMLFRIKTFAQLAQATESNPLPLKP